jgi:hypothetical protein
LSTPLSTSKLELFCDKALIPNATFKKLVAHHNLKDRSNIVIHSGHVQIATLVAICLKAFDVNGFGKVAIRCLCKILGNQDYFIYDGMTL